MTITPNDRTVAPTLLHDVDLVLCDLDGVVYAGPDAIPHAVESLNRAAETSVVAYLTNNASRPDFAVAGHLSSLGLSVEPEHVVTSPQAAMRVLGELVPAGSLILVIGGEGIVVELQRAGYAITRSAEDDAAAVIQGFTPEIGWQHLAEAAFALQSRADIPWIATNADLTIPVARGLAPGNGTLVAAVRAATGRVPIVAGKPERPIFEVARERFAARRPLVIGDRLDTDILGANRAGIASVLVLTGVDRAAAVLAAVPEQRPTSMVSDLRELHQPYPHTLVHDDTITVGDASVRRSADALTIVSLGSPINRLRATSAALWSADGSRHKSLPPEVFLGW